MNSDLQQLRDIHLPHPVTTFPIAPGWMGLLILILALVCWIVYFCYIRHKKNYTVNYALAKLDKLQQLIIENPEKVNIAAEISTLLRRTALYYFRREKIAGLSGEHWLHFLNQSGHNTLFTQETGRLLTDVPYQKETVSDLTPLIVSTRTWLTSIKKNLSGSEK